MSITGLPPIPSTSKVASAYENRIERLQTQIEELQFKISKINRENGEDQTKQQQIDLIRLQIQQIQLQIRRLQYKDDGQRNETEEAKNGEKPVSGNLDVLA